MRRGILALFVRHRTAANLLMLLLVVLGLAALPRLRAQFFPDVVVETISVSVTWPGAGAEEVDRGIIALLEPAVRGVEGITATESVAREGTGRITAEFEPGRDMGRAEEDVRAAVAAAGRLPEGAEEPRIARGLWRDRVTDVVISGPLDREALWRIAVRLRDALFERGITRTSLSGLADPEILIEVPSAALLAEGLDLSTLARRLEGELAVVPAGDLPGAETRVIAGVERRTVALLRELPVRADREGTRRLLGDVARITRAGEDRGLVHLVPGGRALVLRVDRGAGGDVIEALDTVRETVAALRPELPPGVEMTLVHSRARAVGERLGMLLRNGAYGLLLVLALLFLFLSARTAFWVAAGIPVALLATAAFMFAMGMSLNMISLFALIITTGMIVDDAIVVGEHAEFRARSLGERPAIAALRAARRMAPPVIAATLTTVIAFMGLVAVGGRFGQLVRDIPLTVAAVLVASLVECLLILPRHMRHALDAPARIRWLDLPSRVVNRLLAAFRDRAFRPAVRLIIRLRYPVLAAALALLAGQVATVIRDDVPWRFFNAPERSVLYANFALRPGATRADAEAMTRELMRAAQAVGRAHALRDGVNPVRHVLGTVGGTVGHGLAGSATRDPDLLGGVSIELIDADRRPWSAFRLLSEIRQEVRSGPLVETLAFRRGFSGPSGGGIEVRLEGGDARLLKAAAEALEVQLAQLPGVSGPEDTLNWGKRELVLRPTPLADALGTGQGRLAEELRARINGVELARFPLDGRELTLRLQAPVEERGLAFAESMALALPGGGQALIGDLVEMTSRQGIAAIRRENGRQVVTVSAALSEDDPAAAAAITVRLQREILPALAQRFGVRAVLAGQAQDERRFLGEAAAGFALALVGMFVVLAWVFASWWRPLVVMAVIPFGLVGAIWGHARWEVPLSMFSVVGLIGMSGIIVNDAIVLISTMEAHARRRARIPAIIAATAERLRPVLLTTLTTVLGLAPLLFESSVQAQFLRPTVITLVYGLGFGLVLVLLVIPALVAVGEDLRALAAVPRRLWRGGERLGPLRAVAAIYLLGVLAAGALAAALAERLPVMAGHDPATRALVVFVLAAGALAALLFVLAATCRGRRAIRRRSRSA